MITISEWKAMSGKEQTLWLEENKPASRSRHSTKSWFSVLGLMIAIALFVQQLMGAM